jgi:single-strand DNA-binding protein
MTILNINECKFGGRLVADPDLQKTPTDVPVVQFSLAVEDEYQKKGAEQKTVQFPNCNAWRADAEFLCKHAQKGDVIMVTSALKVTPYTDKENVKRWDVNFTVKPGSLKLVQCKKWDEKVAAKKDGSCAAQHTPPVSARSSVEDFAELDDDDDLPF